MARATHLWRRGSRFWWRRRWPRDPENPKFFGPSNFQVTAGSAPIPPKRAEGAPEQVALSLGTGCPDEAARRARRLDALFEHAMELRRAMTATTTAGTGSMGVGAADVALVAVLGAQVGAYARAAAAFPAGDPRRTLAEVRAAEAAMREIDALYAAGVAAPAAAPQASDPILIPTPLAATPDASGAPAPAPVAAPAPAPAAPSQETAPPQASSPPAPSAAKAIATIEVAPPPAPTDEAAGDPPAGEAAPIPGRPSASATAPAPAPMAPPAYPLSQAIEDTIRRKLEEGGQSWRASSLSNWRSAAKNLLQTLGDPDVRSVTQDDMRRFTNLLRSAPNRHGRGENDPPLPEHVRLADEKRAEAVELRKRLESEGLDRGSIETRVGRFLEKWRPLSPATVWKKQMAIKEIFQDLVDAGVVARNPMDKVIWTKKQLQAYQKDFADGRRLDWCGCVDTLFDTPVFTTKLDDPGDPLFWAPLMAYCEGLRMEEALQLKTRDFETHQGIACIRIQQGRSQHLKSEAARRLLPIHPGLVRLGLLKLVARRRAQGQEWLFPRVERCRARGRLSGTFSKVFTAYRREYGVYDPQRDFHSLRTTFHVEMKRRGAPLDARKALLGHAHDDVTDTNYDPSGNPMSFLLDCVAKVPFDFPGIRSPFGEETPRTDRLRLVS